MMYNYSTIVYSIQHSTVNIQFSLFKLMRRGFAPHRSAQSGHLCCRLQPILYDNSVYLFRHTSTPNSARANAVHRIRTCKPFTANDFQDRSLTTRTYGKCSGRSVTTIFEIVFFTALYNFMRTFYRLRQAPLACRKFAQIQGFEP